MFFLMQGVECCSSTSIGFHRVINEEQYKMDFLMYNLKKSRIKFGENQYIDDYTILLRYFSIIKFEFFLNLKEIKM